VYIRHWRGAQKVRHEKKKSLVSRVAMAVFGGATLIVPMLIMVLDQRRITTVSFLFFFFIKYYGRGGRM
jgi:hypothetical protein